MTIVNLIVAIVDAERPESRYTEINYENDIKPLLSPVGIQLNLYFDCFTSILKILQCWPVSVPQRAGGILNLVCPVLPGVIVV